jgi:hypothetical protein
MRQIVVLVETPRSTHAIAHEEKQYALGGKPRHHREFPRRTEDTNGHEF